jgi:hypothetical protein
MTFPRIVIPLYFFAAGPPSIRKDAGVHRLYRKALRAGAAPGIGGLT